MIEALLFLVDTVFGFFILLFLLRFFMQILRTSFFGPLGQFVMTLTNWAARPLRRIIPSWGNVDLSCLLPAFLLQFGLICLKYFLLQRQLLLADNVDLALLLCWWTLLGVIRQSIYLLIGALIIQAVLSWVNPHSPLAAPVGQFTRPFLDPIRRLVPPISGIDLSPLIALVLAQAALFLLRM